MTLPPRIALLAVALAAAFPAAASAAYPGANGTIAFSSTRGGEGYEPGNRDLYSVAADGTGLRRLTDHPAADADPAYSADGTQIAFTSERDGDAEVYLAGADGADPLQLTDSPGFDGEPSWSPDGTRIAFTSARGGDLDVHVLSVAAPADVAPVTAEPGTESQPAWSPDGSLIAFASDRAGPISVWAAAPDGSGATRLSPERGARPEWAPSGQYVAFHSFTGESTDIAAVSPAGPAQITLTGGPDYDFEPAFSPDGHALAFARGGELRVIDEVGNPPPQDGRTLVADDAARTPDWQPLAPPAGADTLEDGPLNVGNPDGEPANGQIAFDDRRAGNRDIYLVGREGDGLRRLTSSPAADYDPSFSPVARFGGQRIAFASSRDGRGDIYTMAIDGSRVRRITHESGIARNPTWSPDGSRIAYETFLGGDSAGIAVVDAEGGIPVRILPCPARATAPACGVSDTDPDWSPGGGWIAFERFGVGTCLTRSDGTDQRCPPLASNPANPDPLLGPALPDDRLQLLTFMDDPAWLRDGSLLAAGVELDIQGTSSAIEGEDIALHRIGIEGLFSPTGLYQLWYDRTALVGIDRNEPEPSPDGRLVAFTEHQRGGTVNIAAIDGDEPDLLDAIEGAGPSWQPLPPGWEFGPEPEVVVRRARRLRGGALRAAVRNWNEFPITGALVVRRAGGQGALRAGGRAVARRRLRLAPESTRRIGVRLGRGGRAPRRGARLRVVLRVVDPGGARETVSGPRVRAHKLSAWVRRAG